MWRWESYRGDLVRILFVTQTPEYGGTERHTVELIRRLEGRARCTIVCLAEDFYTAQLGHLHYVDVVRHPRIWDWRVVRFWNLIWRYRASTVVFPKGTPDQFPLSAYVAARLAGVQRIVCIEHLMWDSAPASIQAKSLGGFLRAIVGWRRRFLLEKWLQGRLVDLTICVSDAIRRRLLREYAYPESQTVVVRNGTDLLHYGRAAGASKSRHTATAPRRFNLLCVARLSPVKRIDLLLEALAILAQSHKEWLCTVVGGGPLEQDLRNQAARLGLAEKVRFIGHVSDTKPYVLEADVCVLPSDKEGLPLSLVEAMAAGVPCVATDVGGTAEIVLNGKTGILVKPGSKEDLAAAIAYFIVHPQEQERMATAASVWANQEFNIDRQLTKFIEVLLPARQSTQA